MTSREMKIIKAADEYRDAVVRKKRLDATKKDAEDRLQAAVAALADLQTAINRAGDTCIELRVALQEAAEST